MKMEKTECSETLAYIIQTPGNYQEESIQHSEHGESLKSRIIPVIPKVREVSGKVTAIVRFLNCLENVDCFLISLNYKKTMCSK
jgi:hypothetical protein